MTFKIDYRDGAVLEWETTADGATYTRVEDYTPTIYLSAASGAAIAELRGILDRHAGVVGTAVESWRTVWREPPEDVLRLDVADLDAVDDVAHEIRGWGAPGEYRLYNVDLGRQFRYWLETRTVDGGRAGTAGAADPPVPGDGRSLVTCELSLPPKQLDDGELAPLAVDGEVVEGDERDVLAHVSATLARVDPDVLVVSSAALVPLLHRAAERHGPPSFRLGRLDGWTQLAGASTFESYGRVGHSPARYDVPGRAIVDRSNSFFWGQTTLGGLLDLVARSHKPLQETAWASIGNVLTSIQIRAAMAAGVLVPWNSWRHEQFKPASTLRDADRGGFTFAPAVGVHEDVHELDFASLYPSIMIEHNISPETVRCACHDRADVPGLGYSICDGEGYLVDVLRRLVADRAADKAALAETTDPDRRAELAGRQSALKWILVSCFGYQGFSNAKFGRIECHEAINAFAREILLETKDHLEAHGWTVVHGIVDSVWVRARPGADQTPLETVAAGVSDAVGIPLEHETRYDWIAFAPRRDGDVGALNRYFAKYADADATADAPDGGPAEPAVAADPDAFKLRGIEARQRHTPSFVADCQLDLLRVLDEDRSPRAVCERLCVHLSRLRAGRVDPDDLVIGRRVSKPLEAYTRATRNVAALERAERQAFEVAPGQSVEYVVVDDDADSAERVRLAFESIDRYDADFYADQLVRAAESVVSPLGWDRADVRRYLADTTGTTLAAY